MQCKPTVNNHQYKLITKEDLSCRCIGYCVSLQEKKEEALQYMVQDLKDVQYVVFS